MPSDADIEARFWKELKASPVVMLGLDSTRDSHIRPMTAHLAEATSGPLWFFTAKDNGLVQTLKESHRAIATYVSKGHDLFASIHGDLQLDNDRATIDRLWNNQVAAWFEHGRDDPKLALLRLDTEKAEIWLGETMIGAAITRLLGRDPKEVNRDKVAKVTL